ncbi:MAG: glycosyltransferase family 4 protein [Crocinitomicaceae bacterium]|jgi:glycosyltransferase involved in cell wall biosynthesis|nr:glycosyltransferase family 4 protein [Crocinitomicaceae bacterium]
MKTGTLLFVQWESQISGSPESARILIESLIQNDWNVHVVVGHEGPYIEIYQKLGCDVSIIPQKHWLSSNTFSAFLRKFPGRIKSYRLFDSLIKKIKPNLVYINTIVGPEAAFAAKRNNTPVIWHIRDMYTDVGGDMKALPILGKQGTKKLITLLANKIITVSKAVATNLFGNDSGIATVVHNGVGEHFYINKLKAPEAELIIGIPGTLRPIKGHQFFLESIAKIAEQLSPLKIRISGEGSKCYADQLHHLAQVPALKNKVDFLGTVTDMPAFLENCDIVVVPSSCDPLPRTVMESMAAGCPLIATRVGGIPEMIDDKKNGYLVDYGDHNMLANCILQLAGDTDLRKQLGLAAAIKARKNFTIAKYQETLLDLIESTAK